MYVDHDYVMQDRRPNRSHLYWRAEGSLLSGWVIRQYATVYSAAVPTESTSAPRFDCHPVAV